MGEGVRGDSSKVVWERPVISPAFAEVVPGGEVSFTVKFKGEPLTDITWSVNDIPGGNETFGTIEDGLYRAPEHVPTPNEVHIVATLRGSEVRHLWSTVIVGGSAPTYRLVERWKGKGEGLGELVELHGICFDRDGNLIVTESKLYHVYRFTRDGDFLGEIGSGRGTDPGFFQGPRDAKVDAEGNIYISDGTNHRIQKFDGSGKLIKVWGKEGSGPGDLLRPHSIDLDAHGHLYVVDVDNSRVTVYDLNGNYLFEWGSEGTDPGQFSAPHGIGVDPNGDVFVAEYNGRCQKFTGDGRLLFTFAESEKKYHAICIDRWGDIYIATRDKKVKSCQMLKYNNNGVFITEWKVNWKDGSEFWPECVAVDSLGYVYVTEHAGVDIFAPTVEQDSDPEVGHGKINSSGPHNR